MRSAKSLHHIISEASITKVFEQVIFVCFDNRLYVLTLMIKVAHTTPILSFIIVPTQLHALFPSLFARFSAIIISANIRRQVLISHTLILFSRESKPSIIRSVMINHYIGNRPNMLLFEGTNHTLEFCLRTER